MWRMMISVFCGGLSIEDGEERFWTELRRGVASPLTILPVRFDVHRFFEYRLISTDILSKKEYFVEGYV
jgi:hypothetical protein